MILQYSLPSALLASILGSVDREDNWEPARVYRGPKERQLLLPDRRSGEVVRPVGPAWTDLARFVHKDIVPAVQMSSGLEIARVSPINLLRYRAGGFFAPHRDRGAAFPNSLFTVLGLLRPATRGGIFCLLEPKKAEYLAQPGDLLVFPSEVLHESTVVLEGTKISIACWLLGSWRTT